MKKNILFILIGIVIGSFFGVVAYNYNAKDIEYNPKDESWDVSNLSDAIDNLKENGEAYGKQANPRGNIYYIPTGGIWQTVWIESVPNNYLKKFVSFLDLYLRSLKEARNIIVDTFKYINGEDIDLDQVSKDAKK